MKNYVGKTTHLIVIQTFFIIFIGFRSANMFVSSKYPHIETGTNEFKSFGKNTTMKSMWKSD